MARRPRLAASIGALVAGLAPATAAANSFTYGSELHFRTGLLSVDFSTPSKTTDGSLTVPNTMDFEYELFSSSRSSYLLRAILAYDVSAARLRYGYTGLGRRYYLFSNGVGFDTVDGGSRVSLAPKWRYYVGGDLGVSQSIVKVAGPVLDVSTAMIDANANIGAMYQVSKVVGVEAQVGFGMGYGISSVAVVATTVRAIVGASYFF